MRIRGTWKLRLTMVSILLAGCKCAHGSVALLMDPTGHAAVYLNHICAASPTELRMCRPDELGVVISRYHKIDGYDWVAMPLIPYLYAVETVNAVPMTVDKAQVATIRDAYRRAYLERLAPDNADGSTPGGEWTQLVGASYDRKIHGFQVETTEEQDERFIALVNDRKNVAHFNLFFHNCADFSRVVLDMYFPHSVHRNYVADVGITTPKQLAKTLVKYGKKHPDVHMTLFIIPQVPGDVKRSHAIDGVTESVVKSKKYLLPLVVLAPEFTGGVVVAYLVQGRGSLPKNAAMFQIDEEVGPGGIGVPVTLPGESEPVAAQGTGTS